MGKLSQAILAAREEDLQEAFAELIAEEGGGVRADEVYTKAQIDAMISDLESRLEAVESK